jgi:CBS domain-containing protein
MLEANVKRFPVMRGERLVGIISRHDLVRVIARTDEDVEAGVKRALTEEGLRLTSLEVRVRDGVVELLGDGDRQTLRLAEILARSVPGVLDVRPAGSG